MSTHANLVDLLDVRLSGADRFVGTCPDYPWGRVYGGQAVAQALVAAGRTVDPQLRPHSLHAYFIRGGRCEVPIHYAVDRIRDGRSFATRRVVGSQGGQAIMNLSASFQVTEAEVTYMPTERRAVPAPGEFDVRFGDPDWSSFFERQALPVQADARSAMWGRIVELTSDDPLLHAAALAYLSDDLPTDAVVQAHPSKPADPFDFEAMFMTTSLDHAMWFHVLDARGWQLHDFRCAALGGARGVSHGTIHGLDGRHIATVTQEVLIRDVRARAQSTDRA